MRAVLLAALLAASLPALADNLSGSYAAPSGPADWRINEHMTLFWKGQPYVPVGLRIPAGEAPVQMAKDAGVTDVLVELPASGTGWKETLEALEDAHLRYVIGIDSLAPAARGIAVEPQTYRVSGIAKNQKVEFPLPGATSALVVLAFQHDASVTWHKRVPVLDDRFSLDVTVPHSGEHVLLVYPEMTGLQFPDYWEGLDTQRDTLLSSLKRFKPGEGLRGIVNPMGTLLRFSGRSVDFVPTNAYFRLEFAEYLERRYTSVSTLHKAWSMSATTIETFEEMARLVPLWSGSRGVSMLWDPEKDQLYRCEGRRSSIWDDVAVTVNTAVARRYERLVSAVRQVTDVPVVQDWAGWASPYETKAPALSGIGFQASGSSPSVLADAGSRAASSVMRWGAAGWLIATRLNLKGATDAAATLPSVIDDLASMGARGWYIETTDRNLIGAVAVENVKRQEDTALSQWSPKGLFFPENAYNPAVPQRLPNGYWWLPSPAAGNRLDFGTLFNAYRYSDGINTFMVIWTTGQQIRTKLKLVEPKNVTAATLDGSDPKMRIHRDAVELNLGPMPIIISGTEEIPVPEQAFLETTAKFDALLLKAEQVRADIIQEGFLFKDNLAGFQRNPAGAYFAIRQLYYAVNQKLGAFTWIEAEASKSHNFSEVASVPGASSGSTLALRVATAIDPRGYFADYEPVMVRSKEEQEVWIAARIPEDQRANVRVMVGSQILHVTDTPVSLYSSGFGWYKLGVTRLEGNTTKVSVQVLGSGSSEVAIDAVVLYPGAFTPNGVWIPELIRDMPIK